MTGQTLSEWLAALRALFPVSEEFRLADAIYPFAADHEAGLTPQQSYERFDFWASSEEEV